MEGGDNNKKYWIIGGLAILGLGALVVKNIIQEKTFVPMKKDQLIQIMTKLKQYNQKNLVELAQCLRRAGPDLRMLTIDYLKQAFSMDNQIYPIKSKLQGNLKTVCNEFGISVGDYEANLKHYEKDADVLKLQVQFEESFEKSLKGQSPVPMKVVPPPQPAPIKKKVQIPEHVTSQIVLDIYHQMVQKTVLNKLEKVREVVEQRISAENINKPQFQNRFSSPIEQHKRILQQANIKDSEGATALQIFNAAVQQFAKNNPNFGKQLQNIDVQFAKMVKKYGSKVDKYQLTIEELDQLESDVIYHQRI